ncbi:MAG: TetR/AcrR family transcriptional regulator [Nitrospirae bacterium]|nr:TetR/AcrR family transcriptional regulator [Nitrospirota bacterium]
MHNTAEASTRDKILEAALRLFSQKGYLGATTREIARESGIAEVTLFRHFPSKERLFEETLNANSFLPALKGLLPEIRRVPYEEALATIAGRFLETLTLRKDTVKIMHSEMQRYPGKIQKIYHAFIDEIVSTLALYFGEMQKKGVLREFDTELAARSFFGMFFSYFDAEEMMLRKKYRHIDAGKTIREFVDIFTRGTVK